VWRTTGHDPYRLYNNLDAEYRPLHDPSLPPRPPQFPERVRAFIYACGQRAFQLEEERLMRQARIIAKSLAG
jgi:hypothetical protein